MVNRIEVTGGAIVHPIEQNAIIFNAYDYRQVELGIANITN